MKPLLVLFIGMLLIACAGEEYPSCSSSRASDSIGKCSAYYYQTDYGSGGKITQALVLCNIDSTQVGGDITSFHNVEFGVGLSWLNANTLEVSVPKGVKLETQKTTDTYLGHQLNYVYRELVPDHTEYKGCNLYHGT